MRARTRAMAAASLTSIALVATACGGGGSTTPDPGASQAAGITGGEISVQGCTPQKGLLPGLTSEACGGDILDAVTAKLVHYNTDTAAPENDIAESIETTDNQNFTVKIKAGYKFSDGTEVKAKNFVDAWNYSANCANGQDANYFFTPFTGYAEINTADCKGVQASGKLTGLKVVDDTSFTIQTSEKVSNLPVRLGYTAFAPLPDSFFSGTGAKDQEKMPVGAGPFMVTGNSATEVVLEKNPNYSGTYKPSVDKATVRIYADAAAAYTDVLAGQLDFVDQVPSDRLIGDAYKTELEGRNSSRAVGGNTWITFSPSDKQIQASPELRKSISKAIDRDLIVKQIFNNAVEKADGWVPPSIDGYKANQCGDACVFDAAKAKEMFTAAGGYKGTLTMSYNADGQNNKQWSEAVANSIKNTLGIEVVATPVVDFATYNNKLENNEIKGIFRNAWQQDYPSIENFLAPIYGTGADSNYARYSSKKFDGELSQAAAASSADAANALYQRAEATLAADFPTAPLWNRSVQVGWSKNVTDVKVNAFGVLDLSSIKRTS
jgi:oligopeptide transport system substrate-binding protein